MVVLTDEDRTARKTHRCEWCGQKIEKGERYHYYGGPHDGGFQSTHMHKECFDQMLEEISYYGDYYEFTPYVNERPEEATK